MVGVKTRFYTTGKPADSCSLYAFRNACQLLRHVFAQARGEVAVYLDLTHMFDGDDAARRAVNLARLLLIPPDGITWALTMMRYSTSRWQHRKAVHLIRISAPITPVEE